MDGVVFGRLECASPCVFTRTMYGEKQTEDPGSSGSSRRRGRSWLASSSLQLVQGPYARSLGVQCALTEMTECAAHTAPPTQFRASNGIPVHLHSGDRGKEACACAFVCVCLRVSVCRSVCVMCRCPGYFPCVGEGGGWGECLSLLPLFSTCNGQHT